MEHSFKRGQKSRGKGLFNELALMEALGGQSGRGFEVIRIDGHYQTPASQAR